MDGRRTLRARKVSTQMAVVDESSRLQAAQARLDALENDNEAGEILAGEGDDEVILHDDEEDDEPLGGGSSKKGKRSVKRPGISKRKLRGGNVGGPRSFSRLLEDFLLDSNQQSSTQNTNNNLPSYLSAAAGPPVSGAPRKLCSVCGHEALYTCSRCHSKFCNRKCYSVHVETRCLKFTL